MKPVRAVLVDDERLARNSLKALLKAHPEVAVAGEAEDLDQAEALIRRLKPDLVFLDIQLPRGNGFQLLERLELEASVIFVTAYDRYAVRAFEVNALDYLLKPVDPERLALALKRAVAAEGGARAIPPPAAGQSLQFEDDILIPVGRTRYFIRVSDILTITVDGNYTTLLTRNGRTHIVLMTLKEWEKRLPHDPFCRLDRNLILNIRQIQRVEPVGREVVVELGPEGHRVELRRTAAVRLKRQMACSS